MYKMKNNYGERIAKAQKVMEREGYSCLILGPSANMYYFTGLKTTPDERLQLVVIPAAGEPAAILPEMYQSKAAEQIAGSFPLLAWADQQDPVDLVKEAVPRKAEGPVAVDDTLWASHLLQIMPVFPEAIFRPASRVVDSLRMFKDEEEIALMARAHAAADRVLERVRQEIRPGMEERELAFFIETAYREEGCDDISFKPIVASGPNSASPHHQTGNRKFQAGDMVVVDCGGLFQGYCSDVTRTFCLGDGDAEIKAVYQAVKEANEAAFQRIGEGYAGEKAGCSGEEADRAAREAITRAGYGPYFIHRTGHGIGLDVHEAPYLVEGNGEKLLPGMVFSIEPGIYLPGRFGVRIEDIVAVTSQGPVRLNRYSRDFLEIQ